MRNCFTLPTALQPQHLKSCVCFLSVLGGIWGSFGGSIGGSIGKIRTKSRKMSPQKSLPKKCARKNATSLHGGPHQPSKTVFRVHETTVFRNGPEPSKVEKLIEKAVLLESILVPTVAKLHKMVIEIRCSIVCSIVCSILCSISGSILCSIWVQVACVATHGRPDLATFRLIGVIQTMASIAVIALHCRQSVYSSIILKSVLTLARTMLMSAKELKSLM